MTVKNIPEFHKGNRFGQKLVHASLQGCPFETCFDVCCATTYERLLEGHVVANELTDLQGDLGAIHIWHTIVKQDNLIQSDVCKNPIFDQLDGHHTIHGAVRRNTKLAQHGLHYLDVHRVVVDYKNLGIHRFFSFFDLAALRHLIDINFTLWRFQALVLHFVWHGIF